MALTAEQIAKKVGVSNATVSRVLNNTQYVSPEAREAVLAAIREAGEPPRLLGRRNKSKIQQAQAGFVEILIAERFQPIEVGPHQPLEAGPHQPLSPETMNKNAVPRLGRIGSFTRHIIEGVVEELRPFGIRAVIQTTRRLDDPTIVSEVNDADNRGVFLFGIYDKDVHDFVDRCRVPVVSFMTWEHNGWPDYVGIDNLTGIRLAFNHLRELGHTKIGYVAGALEFSQVFQQRLAAYRMMLAEAKLPVREDWITRDNCEIGVIQEQVEAMLKPKDRPTAILCSFDGAALGVRRAADKLRLHIPDDLSVIGFDDEDVAQLFSPPLTTVRVPFPLMGRNAVQLMMMRQQRPIKKGEGVSIRVTPTLTIRESAAAVK